MTEFRFAYPLAFGLLGIVLLAMLFGARSQWRPLPPVMRYSDTRLIYGLPMGWRVQFRRLPDVLRFAAWVALIVALARPQSGRAQETLRGEGVDVVFAIDISNSMAAKDFGDQTRLDSAKSFVKNFISGRTADRIGIVVFSDEAFYQAPLTLDYDVLQQLVDDVELAQLSTQDLGSRTDIGLAIASSANLLRESKASSKVIIVLTDAAKEGETGKISPLTAAQAAAVLGMRVYTIGVGKPDTTENGLNEPLLETIAAAANGRYFRAKDAASLHQVYNQINGLERSEVQRQVFVRWQDQAVGWLVAGLALLVVERLLRHTVFQAIP
jgi:Ca-activated chloride channel family protein